MTPPRRTPRKTRVTGPDQPDAVRRRLRDLELAGFLGEES